MESLMEQIQVLRAQNEELIARQYPQWIPIDYTIRYEKGESKLEWDCPLPENGEDVLVTLIDGDVMVATFGENFGFGGFTPSELLAWTKYPEAYKE